MQMRVPYKKLINEFADNFFSDAVLCTMTEDIGTLDRNGKYAKEKDVFKDKKYRAHLKEADEEVDEKKALEVIKGPALEVIRGPVKKAIEKKKADATAAAMAVEEGSGSVVATSTAEEGSATATASAPVATEA